MNDSDQDPFVEVYRPGNQIEAGMIRETLEREGINFYINNEMFQGVYGAVMGSGIYVMKLMVRSSDARRTREIIEGLGLL